MENGGKGGREGGVELASEQNDKELVKMLNYRKGEKRGKVCVFVCRGVLLAYIQQQNVKTVLT